jgi:hypothetical protein
MSGNLYERPVTLGRKEGRAFTGTHGDGSLASDGNANVTAWPGIYAVGSGFRGSSWCSGAYYLRVSDRGNAATYNGDRHYDYGFRSARTE